jgi:hypothetical protein
MSTHDRELLELAAKAMGVEETYPLTDGLYVGSSYDEIVLWNPLTDDGDALRLAVKLNLRVMPQEKCVYVESNPDSVLGFASVSEMEMNGDDPYAATRRSIVRAAAEIGRSME